MSSEAGELELRRVVAAPPSVVFEAFAAADQLAEWWGPQDFTVPSLQFDPRVGNRYRIEMQPPNGEAFHLVGEFREVDAPGRLVFTFVWEPPHADDVEYLAELSFRDLGSSTEISLALGPFRTEARRDFHRHGWTETFDKLERFLDERQVES